MKTRGNYEIENFKVLRKPVRNGNLEEPHIYSGKVLKVPDMIGNGECSTFNITWDKFGRCSNWSREDCFIDVNNINKLK